MVLYWDQIMPACFKKVFWHEFIHMATPIGEFVHTGG
jgi:hypothetical protein